MSMNEDKAKIKEKGEIPFALDQQEEEIQKLDEAVNELINHLEPIMKDTIPDEEVEHPQASSIIASKIKRNNQNIDVLRNKIANIIHNYSAL